MDPNIDNNMGTFNPYHTPQQPRKSTARWGGPNSSGALTLVATEPQVNHKLGDRVIDGEHSAAPSGTEQEGESKGGGVSWELPNCELRHELGTRHCKQIVPFIWFCHGPRSPLWGRGWRRVRGWRDV